MVRLIAIAGWSPVDTTIKLTLDWKALGINPAEATITAPVIKNFQAAAITFAKGKG
ncbi:MAG: glycoside hydrolase domain-containing protein [Mucilaginibacter sp.]|jgi:hypothetical protein|uniref:glycoside hydrolase domain-containing protein n=1 Tax=Mucilaginibacter sp. TaxID=1882438 RepID=UPI0035686C44